MRHAVQHIIQHALGSRLFARARIVARNGVYACVGLIALTSVTACRDLSSPSLPDGTQSPTTYHSREGGLRLSEAALRRFRSVWVDLTITSGLLTDELGNSQPGSSNAIDVRVLPESRSTATTTPGHILYNDLHGLRGQSRLARAVLAEYGRDLSPAIRARLFAFEAYADVWLADLFCSGVPLSTIDFKGDYTYKPSSTTAEVYAHAVTLFDSAIALSADSVAVRTLARVGQARALLALGRYADAEMAVRDVNVTDAYRLRISFMPATTTTDNRFAYSATVSDLEGGNGLPYRTSGDPRTAAPLKTLPVGAISSPLRDVFFPSKYPAPNDSNMIAVASGIEAELTRAEAALQRNEWTTWISLLNALRTTGTYTRIDTVFSDPSNTTISRIDTVWQAGTGGVPGLRPVADPGTDNDRIALHFSERAAWTFVSGQRQGDLRRLVRVYGWPRDEVYPTGSYVGPSVTGLYGSDITLPIAVSELPNPLFKGCLNRD